MSSSIFKTQEHQEKPKPLPPSVSIGCNRVLWEGSEELLEATVQNIDNPTFEWRSDGILIGTDRKHLQKFGPGEHSILLNVTFNNQTLSARKSITVIDSAEGITVRDYEASKNQWRFQTMFKGKETGVKGVTVHVDSLGPSEVNSCGAVSTKALFAGKHQWKAEYRSIGIASGTFNIRETSDLKIDRVEIAPSYSAGSVVKSKIILMNTGSVTVTEFAVRTIAINNNYAWMGDKAKREYIDKYNANIKPGEKYEIPIQMTIPEKVNGIRPAGKYSITVNILLKDQVVDTKIMNTEVI